MLEYEKNLVEYLPTNIDDTHITLTYAQSLDSKISQGRGLRTTLSHEETKEMTQYMRTKHQGILIGSGTIMADDPGLNYKKDLEKSPRPIIIDPLFKFRDKFTDSKIRSLFLCKEGKSPIFVITQAAFDRDAVFLNDFKERGELDYLVLSTRAKEAKESHELLWDEIFSKIYTKFGIKSIMVEGGAYVINNLLSLYPKLITSIVITVAPVFLGDQGVVVEPFQGRLDLHKINNFTGTKDVVMCGTLE